MEKVFKMSKPKYIYGVSSRYAFRQWKHCVYMFETQQAAEKWLNSDTEQRKILKNKTAAVKLAGRKAVERAEELMAMRIYINKQSDLTAHTIGKKSQSNFKIY